MFFMYSQLHLGTVARHKGPIRRCFKVHVIMIQASTSFVPIVVEQHFLSSAPHLIHFTPCSEPIVVVQSSVMYVLLIVILNPGFYLCAPFPKYLVVLNPIVVAIPHTTCLHTFGGFYPPAVNLTLKKT